MIRNITPNDYTKLLFLYQKAFPVHNIFSKSEKEILEYLDKANKPNSEKGGGIFVYEFENEIIGAILLKFKSEYNNHKVWSINHFVIKEEYKGKGIGTELIQYVESKIKKNSKISKIEIYVSENEKNVLEFYKKLGYELEGTIKSHYRYKKDVYFLGKLIE